MIEIFIPTEIPGVLSLHAVDADFLSLMKDHFAVTVIPFESTLFQGLHIISDACSSDLVLLCNGGFGAEYFIDYDWQNTHIKTLGKRFFQPDTIAVELGSITSKFDSIVRDLASETLLTTTKKSESIDKIKHSFFLLAGVVFNLTELLRKTRESILELEIIAIDKEQKAEYRGQSTLLIEPLRTKEIELVASIEVLEQKITLFMDSTKHLITQ